MKLRSWGAAALTVCVMLAHGSAVQAGRAIRGQASNPGYLDEEMQEAELASYNDCDTCLTECDECCSTGNGGRLGGLMNRPLQFVVGAEFLYAKANFSQALSYVEQDLIAGGETWHCYDFDYNESYGFYGGVYLPDCGGSVMFNFRRLSSDASFAAANTSTVNIFGPYEIDNNIRGSADVDLKTYDISFAKTIPLGCALGCKKGCGDCCDDCCDDCSDDCCGSGCGGGWCPAWDITWSGGVRFGDVSWSKGAAAFDLSNGAFIDSYSTRLNWDGFGGRVGLMGRRYIGKRGLVSLYAKGDWSLLVGEYDIVTTVTNAAGSAFLRSSCENIVPVTEIELGGTVHLGNHANLSAGYFWAAWHDLGMRDEYDFNQFQLDSYDDANILGFDGLFARIELTF